MRGSCIEPSAAGRGRRIGTVARVASAARPLALALCVSIASGGCGDGGAGAGGDVAQAPEPAAGGALPGEGSASSAPQVESWLTSAARTATSADGTYLVGWEPVGGVIPDAEPFAIAIEVRRADGRPIDPRATVAVDAEMPHHGHGMNLVPTVQPHPSGAGRFVAEGMLLHMSGRWVLAIDVEEDGVAERTQWHVDVD